MKTLYIDCIAGASGDMLLGALIDVGVQPDELITGLSKLNLPGFNIRIKPVSKNGLKATKLDVVVEDEKAERHVPQIIAVIQNSDLSETVKAKAVQVIQRLGEVEAEIHSNQPENVHLHELGGLDTIVDITGFILGLELLKVEEIIVSPIPLGSGFTRSAHGRIPVPAPATIALLKGTPVKGTDIPMELVTPTGAALLTAFASRFGPLPAMNIESIGYGAGSRDLEIPNVLRMILGQQEADTTPTLMQIDLLESNIDDLSPEIYGYLMDRLYGAGALDVSLIPIYMKKNRPGVLLQVSSPPKNSDELKEIIFRETSTLGIRQQSIARDCLPRKILSVKTKYGQVNIKVAQLPDGSTKFSPEYEDCKKLAEENEAPLTKVIEAARNAFTKEYNISG